MNHQTTDGQIQQAAALLRAGRVDEATRLLLNIHQQFPANFEAVSLLGNIAGHLGKLEDALGYFDTASQLNPRSVETWYYRALALQKLDRHEEAVASFDRALSAHPGLFEALHDRGTSLRLAGRPLEALESLNQAQVLRPDSFAVYYNRALVFGDLKRYEEENRDYDSALRLNPAFVDALINSAVALGLMSRFKEGLERAARAVALEPANAGALFVRAELYAELKDFPAAQADYRAVLVLDPGHAPALSGLASLHAAAKQHDVAAQYFKKLLAIAPDFPYALGKLAYSNMMCSDWSSFESDIAKIRRALEAGKQCVSPFTLLGLVDDPQAHRKAAEILVEDAYKPAEETLATSAYRHAKIRLAYVSADFHEHATSLLMAGLFEQHDKSRFELIAISYGPDDGSAMRKRVVAGFSQFIEVAGKTDREVAQLMRALEIDIAVDLKGHTTDTRLGIFAWRPAPIQVSYLGYPGTTAAPYFDYVLADRHVIPEDSRRDYTEKVVYLPHCYQVNDSRREIAEGPCSRADAGLPRDGFVFSSFNNSYKITPAIFDIWMRLLKGVPGSVLWLLGTSAVQQDNIRAEAARRGVAGERIVFAARLKPAEHLRRLGLSDLYLDNVPYNAHTSASDALWAGVPVLTCQGIAFAGRVAASLLHAVGLPELVCDTPQQYEAMALELALSPARLAELKSRLAANRTVFPLFDTARFTRNLERAFETMVALHARGAAPEAFAVSEDGA